MHHKSEIERIDARLSTAIRAVGNNDFPQALTALLRECVAFDNFIVIAYEGEKNPTVIYRESKDAIVYDLMDTDYVTAVYLLDPFYEAHLQGIKNGIHRLFDLAPDRFRQTSYYEIYYKKTTLIDEIAAFAKTSSGGTITACLGTDKSSDRPFSKKEIAVVRQYSTVICTLIELHWQDYQHHSIEKKAASVPITDRLRAIIQEERGILLSSRQTEVAMFVLQGHSSKSISLIMEISIHTVKIFRRQLYAKCNISSQAELFVMLFPLLSKIDE